MSAEISSVAFMLGPIPGKVSNIGRSIDAVSPHATDSSSTIDEASGRIVTVVVRQQDGSVVAQTPDPQALRVLAGIREMVGHAVDELI